MRLPSPKQAAILAACLASTTVCDALQDSSSRRVPSVPLPEPLTAAQSFRGGVQGSWEERVAERKPGEVRPPRGAEWSYDDDMRSGRPGGGGAAARRRGGRGTPGRRRAEVKGGTVVVHTLVVLSFIVHAVRNVMPLDFLQLHHSRPQLWQLVTALFMHADKEHLMFNMFMLLVFGKMVEEDVGKSALLGSFLVCGALSNGISLWFSPRNVTSQGASGAIFGLYAVSVLAKLLPKHGASAAHRARSLVEAAVFGWFVTATLMDELRLVTSGHATRTNHAAHFAGVTVGALLVWLTRRGAAAGGAGASDDFDSDYDSKAARRGRDAWEAEAEPPRRPDWPGSQQQQPPPQRPKPGAARGGAPLPGGRRGERDRW
ncbi:hypothetical protein JKP88DRAFT_263296 [Tribonema minus]|uniref:Peptidase S54 rhomboid domain-containing protein n=1 Tax=Tribonema minus TaxID=303371 RepID=A0A835YZA0_9STRA|nr:hypothetical protein JKP88DRAFT_263296 [Tribonema minus]